MGSSRTLLLALVFAVVAGPCLADEDDWPVIKGSRVDDQPPALAFAVYRSGSSDTVGVGFYEKRRPGAAAPYLLARRVRGGSGKAVVDWASSETCRPIGPALAKLAQMPTPRIRPPTTSKTRRPAGQLDSSSYLFWATDAHWTPNDAGAGMELRALGGSPVAAWSEQTLKAIAACWTPARP